MLLAEARRAARDGRAKVLRERARLSQAEVARTCHVTAPAVTRWEQGSREPRGEAALRYARLLGRLGLEPAAAPDALEAV